MSNKKKKFLSQTQVVSVVLITGVALILAGTAYYWGVPLIEKTRKSIDIQDTENFLITLINTMEEVAETGDTKTITFKVQGSFDVNTDKDEITYTIKSPSVSYAVSTFVPLNDMPPFKKNVVVFSCGETKNVPSMNKSPVVECSATLDCDTNSINFDTSVCDVPKQKYNDSEIASSIHNDVSYRVITSYAPEYKIGYLEDTKEEKLVGLKGQNHNLVLLAKAEKAPATNIFVNIYRIVSREIDDGKTMNGYYIDLVGNNLHLEQGQEAKLVISREGSEVKAGESALGGDLNIIKIKVEAY